MKKSDIRFSVTLNENKFPEKILWSADDSGIEGEKECSSVMISIWDAKDKSTLRILPNVANGGIIKAEFFLTEKDKLKGELVIFDVNGRSIIIQDIAAQKGYNVIETDVSSFPNGIYYVVLSGIKDSPLTERLVISE